MAAADHPPPRHALAPGSRIDVDGSLGDRFLAVATAHPDALALSSPAGRWTYAQLAAEVEGRASGIRAAVGRSDPTPVALLTTHDGPLVVSLLAIVAAGHVVVVLDPQAPVEQTVHLLDESGAVLVLHDDAHRELAAEVAERSTHHPTPVLAASLTGDTGDQAPVGPSPRTGTDPAMLAFTSGTTGASRGATVTHGVILNMVRGATEALGITAADRMPMLFPMALAAAAYPMFIPLLNGGTLATLDVRGVGLEPIPRFLADERISLFYMSPTVIRFLEDTVSGHDFPDLRLVALGGEVVDRDLVELTARMFGVPLVANGFGTTETGVISLHVVDAAHPPEGAVPSGRPVAGVELTVVDEDGRAVSTDEVGEILISSAHLFAGYWGHPEVDAAVLSDVGDGRRRYRTGDLGRVDADGVLTVLGRADTKVKVRGRFVVLGEVESLLRSHDAVNEAVVVPVVHDHVTSLTAIVVPADPATFDPVRHRADVLATEEAYRVPSSWIVVDALPLLPNGKLDRRACRALAGATGGDTQPVEPGGPEGRTLRELRNIWEELLPGGIIGPDDDFFHLGGDSLLAAQMLVVVDQRLGVTVPMGELVHATTLRSLSEVVARIGTAEGTPTTAACVQAGVDGATPLWFVHDLQGSAYRVRHLARELGDDVPVWSFESPLLRGIRSPFSSLDTFAANYVTDLRSVQPDGPYRLAGYCFGGICAYEMARQLRREGEDVELLAIVDVGPGYRGVGGDDRRSPFRPWFGVAKPPPAGTSLPGRYRYYRALLAASPAAFARHVMVRSGVARVVDPIRFRIDLARTGRVRPEWRLWYAWEEHWRLAARRWDRTRSYDGPVHLFWATDTASADATMGWGPLTDDLEVVRFDGDHEGILEPRGAAALARALRPVLDASAPSSTGA